MQHFEPIMLITLLLENQYLSLWAGAAVNILPVKFQTIYISVNLNLINLFQSDRADNVLSGTKQEMMQKIRNDIKDFKEKKNLDKVF